MCDHKHLMFTRHPEWPNLVVSSFRLMDCKIQNLSRTPLCFVVVIVVVVLVVVFLPNNVLDSLASSQHYNESLLCWITQLLYKYIWKARSSIKQTVIEIYISLCIYGNDFSYTATTVVGTKRST